MFELGGDVTRPLAGGAIKLVGLATRRKRDYFDATSLRDGLLEDGAVQVGGFEQIQKAKRNETIGRAELDPRRTSPASRSRPASKARSTRSTTRSSCSTIEDGGSRSAIDLPVDQAKVKEKRGEAFVNVGRQLSPGAPRSMPASITNIRSSRSAATPSADRTLKFWKPSVDPRLEAGRRLARASCRSAHRRPARLLRLHQRRRAVGRPGQCRQRQPACRSSAWEFRGTVDRPLLGDGLVKLDLGYDLVSMLQDRVLICDPMIRTSASTRRATSAPASAISPR